MFINWWNLKGTGNALQRKSHLCIPFLGIAWPQPKFQNSCVCERFMYSPKIGLHISSSRIGRPIVEVYKSLTDAWMWKLGPRPDIHFLGIFVLKIRYFVFAVCVQRSYSSFLCAPNSSILNLRKPATPSKWKVQWRPVLNSSSNFFLLFDKRCPKLDDLVGRGSKKNTESKT